VSKSIADEYVLKKYKSIQLKQADVSWHSVTLNKLFSVSCQSTVLIILFVVKYNIVIFKDFFAFLSCTWY